MDLLDRYLQAVRGYLPDRRRDDIVRELGANMTSQIEDKSAELDRELNESEVADILRQHGHPLVAAARYRRLPMQQVVGPTLFPLYWYAVQAVVAFVTLFHVMAFLVQLLAHRGMMSALASTWGSYFVSVATSVGFITIFFGVLEYLGGKIPFTNTFNPRELPPLRKTGPRPANSIVELMLGVLFLVAWPLFLHGPSPAFARELPFQLGPVWRHSEIPILLSVAFGVAAALAHLFRPQLPYLRSILRMTSDVTGMITAWFFMRAGDMIVAHNDEAGQMSRLVHFGDRLMTVGQVVNWALDLVRIVVIFIFVIDLIVEAFRLSRLYRVPAVAVKQVNGAS